VLREPGKGKPVKAQRQGRSRMAEAWPDRPRAHLKVEQQLRHATCDAARDQGETMNPTKAPSHAEMVRRQADTLVDEFPDCSLEILAADLESDPETHEGFEMARAVAVELRRRAIAGIRKWTGPKRR
jgi:hypothetical protein